MSIKSTIKKELYQTLEKKYQLKDINFQIEYPPDSQMGDYSSNIAMMLARKLKKNPLKIGQGIVKTLNTLKSLKEIFDKIEVAKPGFINFYLNEKTLLDNVNEILKNKDNFGQLKAPKRLNIQVEFISANPTGPLTLANGRGGFSGDVLANILELAGHKVQREYLVNDYGNQIKNLAESLKKTDHNIKELGFDYEKKDRKILKETEKNKNLYKGKYIVDLLEQFDKQHKKPMKDYMEKDVCKWATNEILENHIKPIIAKVGIEFDSYFSERRMHESSKIDKIFKYLQKNNLVYEKDGAWWLKTNVATEHATELIHEQDDKDRVLIKSDGSKTYFLVDIAYHWNKFHDRKFDKVINLWGADHHGYVARMKSAVALLGYPNQLEILLMQLMRLIENGKEVRMSKRKGVYVLLEDLVDEVGLDVTRFFFLMHANNKAMDFDLKLAKEKSKKNPVYYVQYAHARVCSILKKTSECKIRKDKACLVSTAECELIKELIKWPELISDVAQNYEVHKICFYTISLADKFHDFYENCKVIENNQVNKFRLDLIKATQQVLQNSLKCLGVSAPEKM